jgi:LuxR family transcriptional regulator, maltose regulon positive regulatory protein
MKTLEGVQNQVLATKFYMPTVPGPLISRPRLTSLLNESLNYPFTLVSAPAGFGKTTLLATWGRSLTASNSWLCWVSLDKEDNEPQLFWTLILTALTRQQPERFTALLEQVQHMQVCRLPG